MKKLIFILIAGAAIMFLTNCNNQDQKDEAADVNVVKITVDVVAEDFNGTETTSGSAMATLPK